MDGELPDSGPKDGGRGDAGSAHSEMEERMNHKTKKKVSGIYIHIAGPNHVFHFVAYPFYRAFPYRLQNGMA